MPPTAPTVGGTLKLRITNEGDTMEQHNLTVPALCELAERIAFSSGINAYQLDDFREIADEAGHDHEVLPEGFDLTDADVADLRTLLSGATLILPTRAIG